MGLIKIIRLFAIPIFILGLSVSLDAQGLLLAPEIERLEKQALIQDQKHEAATSLARIYQLSGNREKALENWVTAVSAEPGKVDYYALLEAVKLWISIGDYEKAGAELRAIIFSCTDEKILYSAQFLSAQLYAFRTGSGEPLSYFIQNPAYRLIQSRIFYTLWKTTENPCWKSMLLEAYPQSPEAEILKNNSSVSAAVTPQWLLFRPRENPGSAAVVQTASVPAASPDQSAAVPLAASQVLQTGLFSREDNCKALYDKLIKAGFSPEITRRSTNRGDLWAVIIKPGADINRTIRELKEAGFESFPVSKE